MRIPNRGIKDMVKDREYEPIVGKGVLHELRLWPSV